MRNKENKEKKKKSLEDYEHYIGSSKQACDFEVTTNYIMNHIQKNFDSGRDIAETLRTLSPLHTDTWRPRMQVSEIEDESVRDRENREFELDYVDESADYRKSAREDIKDLSKAHALL